MPRATAGTHPHTIFVTSLFEMPRFVRELAPVRVLSIIQPELQPERPRELEEARHLRVAVHDISEHSPDQILAARRDVETLIDFAQSWDPAEGAFLAHCYAGVSRSTAAALIAATMKTGDPHWSARQLRAAAPHAQPNRRIIALADEVLALDGELIRARESMGQAMSVFEGPLTVLRIGS
ncbi:MAG: tyrosine phosphatase family protein [Pseudomonadales bacterium]